MSLYYSVLTICKINKKYLLKHFIECFTILIFLIEYIKHVKHT